MDFQHPCTTEQLLFLALLFFASVAVFTGYLTASLKMMIVVYGGGVFIASLILVPDWQYFYRHPREWMQPKTMGDASCSINSRARFEVLTSSFLHSKRQN
ncbi:hypothetical protein O6H91_13G100000 [Diphasiastrum complanatum]|uniref:Uncharacterized protein n=3 Tax=Diphasiastrum complanatum TaxID=34168 RepID=A0ACC2BXS8_DIPCM|nr:hypothetical protein O6H91_13G097500 [Diphasiastrum complanatum]KAJ7534515.1 hypothetical protein O6H91_13G097500 [Diphasiastrum complanatum]KAJ7534566.1 hypothetical protein O6H91_13G100000 [Diphasiastrum complanatum]